MSSLVSEIETFIAAHGLTERSFGDMALNDTKVVADLRNGREPRRATVERLRCFMATYPNHEPFEPRRKLAA